MFELSILIIGFIILSGLLAMIDAAVLSISRAEIEEMVMKKKYGAVPLRWINAHMTKAVVVIVIATNIVNVLGPILVGQKAVDLFGSNVIGVITGVLTFLTIIFSEILPKSLGSHYAPLISRIVAPIIVSATVILYPIVWLLEKFTALFTKGKRKIGTEAQIQSLVNIGGTAGHIEADEGQLIKRAFKLNDRLAKDIIAPKHSVVALEKNATIRDAANIVFEHSYSRYPIYDTTMDNVLGIVMSNDILGKLAAGKDDEQITSIMREVLKVDANKRCDDLLIMFRVKGIHLAIAQEHGKTLGLLTLEDVLEELVGEIEDEGDRDEG